MKTAESRKKRSMQAWQQDSWLTGTNDVWLESLYETWLANPTDVSPEWQTYFSQLASGSSDASHEAVKQYFLNLAKHPRSYSIAQDLVQGDARTLHLQEKVTDFIAAYRSEGHLLAAIDPLGFRQITSSRLDPAAYGLQNEGERIFDADGLGGLPSTSASFSEIEKALRKIYCGSIGIEYMHITRAEETAWIQHRMEHGWSAFSPTLDEKKRLLDELIAADGLEKYIGMKYVGQKRFSLEGGDSLIPLLNTLVVHGAETGVKEIVIGMAHRGRLNVLVNVLGKEPAQVFSGFEEKQVTNGYSGDVKYHMGYSSDVKTAAGSVHLSLAFNPSHLEIVSPVVQGSVRSRQRRRKDAKQHQVVPVQIHGDAAFAGQGVVMETFNLSQTRWFTVGGSIHIVINNQVGFTTSDPRDARSSLYCTDVAKMVEAPILHVNGNDPEAILFAARLAADYRARFKRDVVIDLFCYRRHGHNEADEPSATQPLMYQKIHKMPVPYVLYAEKLQAAGVIDAGFDKTLAQRYREKLESGKSVVALDAVYEYTNAWEKFHGTQWQTPVNTAVSLQLLQQIGVQLEKLPPQFVVQPQVKKMLDARQKMTAGELPLNWGYAETLAYATLLVEGYPIRLCGQDAARGTFSHRHAVLHDQKTDEVYIPLSHVNDQQAQINIVDSVLSEEAVLAFEYGYACAEPNNLVLWEAQFGDFANGAQVVFDQFISSGEQKWGRLCGLVVLLPHGYEGQGPEHSSARPERFLQLCAQENMQVCMPTTPAQIFHLLRRQMLRPWRKPLIVMTPKSLLRHPRAISSLNDLSKGGFQNVIPDTLIKNPRKLIFCSGKVYYDLLEKRELLAAEEQDKNTKKLDDVALIRLEQLYPFPAEEVKKILRDFSEVKEIVWCQEEPMNQGAWLYLQQMLPACLLAGQSLHYAGRPASASPAAGYASLHRAEQTALVAQALQ